MKKKVKKESGALRELQETCSRIYDFFDNLTLESDYGEDHPFDSVIDPYFVLDQIEAIRKKSAKKEDLRHDDMVYPIWDFKELCFSIGFVMGGSFEITHPEAQKDIDTIKKLIKEKSLLPYLPKAKKAA